MRKMKLKSACIYYVVYSILLYMLSVIRPLMIYISSVCSRAFVYRNILLAFLFIFIIFFSWYAPISIIWWGEGDSYTPTYSFIPQGKILAIKLILLRNIPTLVRRSRRDIWRLFIYIYFFVSVYLTERFFYEPFLHCLVILKYSVCYFFSFLGFPLVLNFIRFFRRKNNAKYI